MRLRSVAIAFLGLAAWLLSPAAAQGPYESYMWSGCAAYCSSGLDPGRSSGEVRGEEPMNEGRSHVRLPGQCRVLRAAAMQRGSA
jgi:hypothetical protein